MSLFRSSVIAAAALAAVSIAAPTTASAQAPQVSNAITDDGPLALDSCTGGSTFRRSGSSDLSNGTLSAGFCTYSAGGVGTVNIQYKKTSGPAATVRFAWEWVDRSGSNPTGRRYDNGAFTISAGQTRFFQWSYPSPGIYSPSGNAPCRRGVLTQGPNTFSTAVVC